MNLFIKNKLVYLSYLLYLFCFVSNLGAQEAGSTLKKEKEQFPKVQAEIVRELNLKEIDSDARRRLIYTRELVSDGHFLRALQNLEDFAILYPTHKNLFNIYKLSAEAHAGLGSSMLAVQSYKNAFYHARDEARGVKAYLKAGKILSDVGQIDQATKIFRHISNIRPSSLYSKQAEYELNSFPLKQKSIDESKTRNIRGGIENKDAGTDSRNNQEENTLNIENEKPLINNPENENIKKVNTTEKNDIQSDEINNANKTSTAATGNNLQIRPGTAKKAVPSNDLIGEGI